jgi:predicted transcriptional regulator
VTESVSVRLDRFAHDAVDAYARESGGSHADALRTAVRYFLADSGSGRPGWPVPQAARPAASGEPLEVELDDDLYAELELEARRQEVAPEVIAVHAFMYFLADRETGRAAARLGGAVGDAEAR